MNARANCITNTEVLEDLKQQKEEKVAMEREKSKQQLEMEKRRQERERKKKKQEEKERKKQEHEKKKIDKRRIDQKQPRTQTTSNSRKTCASVLVPELQQLNIESTDSREESGAECPECGLVYGSAQDEELWVQCDNCAAWWDITCAGVNKNIADSMFVCSNSIVS